MAFSKLLLRLIKPYLIILVITLLYLAYLQFKKSEQMVYQQSHEAILTAKNLIDAHIEATYSKFYLLEQQMTQHPVLTPNTFSVLTHHVLEHSHNYSDVLHRQQDKLIDSRGKPLEIPQPEWHPLPTISDSFLVSSLYQNTEKRWVFAVKYLSPAIDELWIEFDLMYLTQHLRGLKVLNDGYIFVVDRATQRLVFHPELDRVGTYSISFHDSIKTQIDQGMRFGHHEYSYQNSLKITVFDADSPMNWVFLAGTNQADVLSSSGQYLLTAIAIASLLVIVFIISVLAVRLNQCFVLIKQAKSLLEFKNAILNLFDTFYYHGGIQFCLYHSSSHTFSTLDYHGNHKPILVDADLPDQFAHYCEQKNHTEDIHFCRRNQTDRLATLLKIDSAHYRVPLYHQSELIAVIYLSCPWPAFRYLFQLICRYTEVTLANLVLQQKLAVQDPLTQLENKQAIKSTTEQYLPLQSTQTPALFFALIDIDNFSRINHLHTPVFGDQIINHVAQQIQEFFPKPNTKCLARYEGDQFAVLFCANDHDDAFNQLDKMRSAIATTGIKIRHDEIKVTVSIGLTSCLNDFINCKNLAEKALIKAKNLGKNKVIPHYY